MGLTVLKFKSLLVYFIRTSTYITANNLNYPSLSHVIRYLFLAQIFHVSKASTRCITYTLTKLKMQHKIYCHHNYH